MITRVQPQQLNNAFAAKQVASAAKQHFGTTLNLGTVYFAANTTAHAVEKPAATQAGFLSKVITFFNDAFSAQSALGTDMTAARVRSFAAQHNATFSADADKTFNNKSTRREPGVLNFLA